MTYIKDNDKKTRALMAALIETSKDCCECGDCCLCLMATVDRDCGSIKLRELLNTIRFARDE